MSYTTASADDNVIASATIDSLRDENVAMRKLLGAYAIGRKMLRDSRNAPETIDAWNILDDVEREARKLWE